MKAEELKGKTIDELKAILMDLRKEQFEMRFNAVSGQLEKTHTVRVVRRNIARVKTYLTQKSKAA